MKRIARFLLPTRKTLVPAANSTATAALLSLASLAFAQEPAADFPQFRVPGQEVEMKALDRKSVV